MIGWLFALIAVLPLQEIPSDLALQMVQQRPRLYQKLPQLFKEDRKIIEAACYNESLFWDFPDSVKNGPTLLALSEINPDLLNFMKEEWLNELSFDEYKIALKRCPALLKAPCRHPISEELFLTALEADGTLLFRLPEHLQSYKRCLAAVKGTGSLLKYIPAKWHTEELVFAAVQSEGGILEDIPEASRSLELCRCAVESAGDALEYVPHPLRTYELCLAAVRSSGWALPFVPRNHQTPEIFLAAVQCTPLALDCVPYKFRTLKVCLAALLRDPSAYESVPDALLPEVTALAQSKGCDLRAFFLPLASAVLALNPAE